MKCHSVIFRTWGAPGFQLWTQTEAYLPSRPTASSFSSSSDNSCTTLSCFVLWVNLRRLTTFVVLPQDLTSQSSHTHHIQPSHCSENWKVPHMTASKVRHPHCQLTVQRLSHLQSCSLHTTVTGGRRSSSFQACIVLTRSLWERCYCLLCPCWW